MGADEIIMDRASVLMIHDPSGVTIGPAADHRRTAEDLERLAAVYARAYAERSFNRVEDVRAWMLAETWLTAEEAVALGFADRIEEAAAVRPSQDVVARARALWTAATAPKGELNGTA
jgi:ATP-dependent protease ClpP protease subunit